MTAETMKGILSTAFTIITLALLFLAATSGFSESANISIPSSSTLTAFYLGVTGQERTTTNQAPVVNAGPDQTAVFLGPFQLTGIASDDGRPNSTLSLQWSNVSGPGSVLFYSPQALSTGARFGTTGVYLLRLTANDGALTSSDDVLVTVVETGSSGSTGSTGSTSSPPPPPTTAAVSADKSSIAPGQTLVATWTGISTAGAYDFIGMYRKSQVADRGNYANYVYTYDGSQNFDPAAVGRASGSLNFLVPVGTPADTWELRLFSGEPSVLLARSQPIIVTAPVVTSNQAPVVNAGPDQTAVFLAPFQLTGAASDDGRPNSTLSVQWSMMGGPGSLLFDSPQALSTSVRFGTTGVYVLRLSANDGALTSSDDVLVTVVETGSSGSTGSTGSTSSPPPPTTAAVSADKSSIAPGQTLVATWTGIPTAGAYDFIGMYRKSQVAERGNYANYVYTYDGSQNFDPAAVGRASGSLNFLVPVGTPADTWELRLFSGETFVLLARSQPIIVTAPVVTSNQAPVVNAGPDQTLTFPAGATLSGTVSDDGLPSGSTVTASWSKVSGPGTVTFGSSASKTTMAFFSTAGTYVLRLAASDSALTSVDDLSVVVASSTTSSTTSSAPTNQAPVVNAGPDQTINWPAVAVLAGVVSDDLLPSGSTLTTSWSQISGPAPAKFSNPSALNASVTFTAAGTYVLRLTASDTQLTSSDDVTIVVNCGMTVSGIVTIFADATDNVGVAGLQLKLDSATFGPELTIAPYSITWDTTRTPNGCHTITATATDAAGNQGSTSVVANVINP